MGAAPKGRSDAKIRTLRARDATTLALCRLALSISKARICAAGYLKYLPSGASAVVDENLLAGNDLSLGRLAAINLLRGCWAEQQERRKGKREDTAACHGNLISRQEYLKDPDDRSSIAPSARSRPIPDIRRLAPLRASATGSHEIEPIDIDQSLIGDLEMRDHR